MAYTDQKILTGREPVVYAEIDFLACSLTYGTGACTASGSGDEKCFQNFASCQAKSAFASNTFTKTLRFSSVRIDQIQGSTDVPTIPTLVGLSLSPTSLTPGEGLGIRSTCNITLEDHPYSMVGIDKYISDRTYIHADRGSFWSRFLNMFPYYTGNEVRVFTGFIEEDGTYDVANFRSRTYFIETITGPSASGKVGIKCKDALRFGDKEKATVPTQSQAVLSADISAGATSFDISDPNDDVKDAYDAGQTYIRIDDETMLMTNLTGASSPYTLTVTRAAMPSFYTGTMTAEAHDEDATVQHCYYADDLEIDDLVYYLLNTGAGVDASYMPTSEWQDVIDFGLQSYLFSALITEPTGVKDLLDEIAEHTILMWWDERSAEIKLGSIIKSGTNYGAYDDTQHILADSVSVARDDSARISQAWMAFGHRNPVLELDKLSNYASVYVSADADAEGVNEYDQKKIKRVFSRWLPLSKRSVATEITNRYLNYYKDTKNLVSLELDPKDDEAWTGDFMTLATRQVQDTNGTTPTRGYRVLEANEKTMAGNVRYQYKLQSTSSAFGGASSRYGLIGPNTLGDYSSESEDNKNKYAFIAADDRGDGNPGFPTTDEPYKII